MEIGSNLCLNPCFQQWEFESLPGYHERSKVSVIKVFCLHVFLGEFLEETVLQKVKEIGKKLDELRDFLEDVFLTKEEYVLLKETDEIVRNKRFDELKSLDEV
jgi:hypothetical protein